MNYNFFDKIYCINLITRNDRYMSATNTFNKLNIKNVEFCRVNKSDKGGRYGCFESHIDIIKKSLKLNLNNILIFEDDIRPSNYYNLELLNNSIKFMKNNNWDVFYLGYLASNKNYFRDNIFMSHNNISKNIISYNPGATHAYCLNNNSMKKILLHYEKYINNTHYDMFLTNKKIFNNYCTIPMLFEQNWCYDIDNSIHGFDEYFLRKCQCFCGDYLNINSNISYLIYLFNYFKIVIYILILIIIFICINKYVKN